MEERKLLFIANPTAGQKKIVGNMTQIVQIFCAAGYIPTVLTTQYAGHATELAEKYAGEFDLVVCAGGDGTLNETLSGLMRGGYDKPVGYLPCGTTNDLGSTLGLSSSLIKAAEDVVTGREFLLDLGSFNGRSFVYTASFGAFTNVSYETPQVFKNVLGHLAYLLTGVSEVWKLKPISARIETDAGDFEGDFLFGSVNNSTSLAGILTIDRDLVKLDDGKHELLLVDMPKNAIDLGKLLINLTQKRFEDGLHLLSVSRMSMQTTQPIDWTLDGEQEKGDTSIEIVNLPRAARIIVPREA